MNRFGCFDQLTHRIPQHWDLCKLFNSAMQLPTIEEQVAPSTIMRSDDWRGYSRASELPHVSCHEVVNHSVNIVDPASSVHTQNIESYLGLSLYIQKFTYYSYQKFYPIFLSYSHSTIEYLTVLLDYPDFCKLGFRVQQAFGRAWVLPGMPMAIPLLKLMCLVFHMFQQFQFLVILVLCLCTAYVYIFPELFLLKL